jgi:RND family efflux transporter MFP subunit
MRKILIIAIILLVIAGIAAILNYNKSKIAMKTKMTSVETVYSVSVTKVEESFIDRSLTVTGITAADKEVIVSSETQGKVMSVNFDVGDRVNAGKILVVVDDEIKKATLLNAEAALEKAKKDFERFEQLNKEHSINDAQLDAARFSYKSAQSQFIIASKQLKDTKIIAPFAGYITTKNIESGSVISTGTPIATLIDISNIKIKVNIPEEDVFKLKDNGITDIETDLYPGATIEGKIKSIGAKADEAHSYPIEITLRNQKGFELKAGMFVSVKFPSIIKKKCIIINREAVIGGLKDPKIYIVESGVAKLRGIVCGEEYNGKIEVLSGLNLNDVVVIDGQINLKNGSHVKISN